MARRATSHLGGSVKVILSGAQEHEMFGLKNVLQGITCSRGILPLLSLVVGCLAEKVELWKSCLHCLMMTTVKPTIL